MKAIVAGTENRYGDLEVEGGVLRSYTSPTVLRYNGRRWGIGMVPAGTGDTVVLVNRGPGRARDIVTEPEAFAYGLAVCIDNFGGTARESAELTAAGREHDVVDGDRVCFWAPEGGVMFTVGGKGTGRYRDLTLTLDTGVAIERVNAVLDRLDTEDDDVVRADLIDELIGLADAYGGAVRDVVRAGGVPA